MKILILIPCWKRPEILKICIQGIKHLRQNITGHEFIPLFIISLEDPYIREIFALVKKYKFITYKNKFIGEKHNAGVNYALKNMEWDYLMNLGSDDVVNPDLFNNHYNNLLQDATPLLGLSDFHVYSWYEKLFYYLPQHNGPLCIGGARLIDRSILEWMHEHQYNLYSNELNHGLDANSFQRIYEQTGHQATSPLTGDLPMLVDIKTHTNINHLLQLKNYENVKTISSSKIYSVFPALENILKL